MCKTFTGPPANGKCRLVLNQMFFFYSVSALLPFVVNGLYTELKGTATPNRTTTQFAPKTWTTPA
jgi:hypothetical protein